MFHYCSFCREHFIIASNCIHLQKFHVLLLFDDRHVSFHVNYFYRKYESGFHIPHGCFEDSIRYVSGSLQEIS